MNDPPDGDVLSLNADSLTLTAECNHVLYKPCIVININKPHLETVDGMPQAGSHYNFGTSRGPDKIGSRAAPGPRAASCTWLS